MVLWEVNLVCEVHPHRVDIGVEEHLLHHGLSDLRRLGAIYLANFAQNLILLEEGHRQGAAIMIDDA